MFSFDKKYKSRHTMRLRRTERIEIVGVFVCVCHYRAISARAKLYSFLLALFCSHRLISIKVFKRINAKKKQLF